MALEAVADIMPVVLHWRELSVNMVENRRMPVDEAKENNQNGLMVGRP